MSTHSGLVTIGNTLCPAVLVLCIISLPTRKYLPIMQHHTGLTYLTILVFLDRNIGMPDSCMTSIQPSGSTSKGSLPICHSVCRVFTSMIFPSVLRLERENSSKDGWICFLVVNHKPNWFMGLNKNLLYVSKRVKQPQWPGNLMWNRDEKDAMKTVGMRQGKLVEC